MNQKLDRRNFAKTCLKALAAVPVFMLFSKESKAAMCQGDGKIKDQGKAKAMGYVADAKSAAKAPNFKAGSSCSNCALYNKVTDATGFCPLFGGECVAGKGWCNSWAPKG